MTMKERKTKTTNSDKPKKVVASIRLKVKEIKVTTTFVLFPTKRSTFKVSIRTTLVISKSFFFYIVFASIPNALLKK
jgi:hypothetical protein